MSNMRKLIVIALLVLLSGCSSNLKYKLQDHQSHGFQVDDTHHSWHSRYFNETVASCKKQDTMSEIDCLRDKKFIINGIGVHPANIHERVMITADVRKILRDGGRDTSAVAREGVTALRLMESLPFTIDLKGSVASGAHVVEDLNSCREVIRSGTIRKKRNMLPVMGRIIVETSTPMEKCMVGRGYSVLSY